MSDLNALRQKINELDEKMRNCYVQRLQVAAQVAQYKSKHGLPVRDPLREQQVICQNSQAVSQELQPLYADFLRDLMKNSRRYQQLQNGQSVALFGISPQLAKEIPTFMPLFSKTVGFCTVNTVNQLLQQVSEGQVLAGVLSTDNLSPQDMAQLLNLLTNYTDLCLFSKNNLFFIIQQ